MASQHLQQALQTTGITFIYGNTLIITRQCRAVCLAFFCLSIPEYFFQRQFFYIAIFFQVIGTDFFL